MAAFADRGGGDAAGAPSSASVEARLSERGIRNLMDMMFSCVVCHEDFGDPSRRSSRGGGGDSTTDEQRRGHVYACAQCSARVCGACITRCLECPQRCGSTSVLTRCLQLELMHATLLADRQHICEECGSTTCKDPALTPHSDTCSKSPILCSCGLVITRGNMVIHGFSCADRPRSCLYDPCEFYVNPSETEEHLHTAHPTIPLFQIPTGTVLLLRFAARSPYPPFVCKVPVLPHRLPSFQPDHPHPAPAAEPPRHIFLYACNMHDGVSISSAQPALASPVFLYATGHWMTQTGHTPLGSSTSIGQIPCTSHVRFGTRPTHEPTMCILMLYVEEQADERHTQNTLRRIYNHMESAVSLSAEFKELRSIPPDSNGILFPQITSRLFVLPP